MLPTGFSTHLKDRRIRRVGYGYTTSRRSSGHIICTELYSEALCGKLYSRNTGILKNNRNSKVFVPHKLKSLCTH